MKASEIKWRRVNGELYAACCCKVYWFPHPSDFQAILPMADHHASKLCDRLWHTYCNDFWNMWLVEISRDMFPERRLKDMPTSDGRSEGWVVMKIDPKNFRDVQRWSRLCAEIEEYVKTMKSPLKMLHYALDSGILKDVLED